MPDFFDYHTHDYNRKNAFISVKAEDLSTDFAVPEGSRIFLEYHPWNLPQTFIGLSLDFVKLAASDNVYGIGEVGLDKLKVNQVSLDVQLAYFEELAALADKLEKPIMLHVVRAWQEAREILKKHRFPMIYFHGFYGKTEFLHELLEFGVTVSCNPKMLERLEFFDFLKKNPEYFDRIKLETDDSNFDISCLYTKFYEGMNK